jgi:hypothetical protein
MTHRDITGLTWTAQMYGCPYDLLAAKLGVTGDRARGIVLRWRLAKLADSGILMHGPAWCWITQHGLRQLGYQWTAQAPAMSRLEHIRAVAASRLWLESGEHWQQWRARWRCERQIRAAAPGTGTQGHGAGRMGHVPDAEVIWPSVPGSPRAGEQWAIEAELTPKPLGRTQAILSALLAGPYARVVYLCSPQALAIVGHASQRFSAEQSARVIVRPLPPAARTPGAA